MSIELGEAGAEPSEPHPSLGRRARGPRATRTLRAAKLPAVRDAGRIRDILRHLSDILPGHFAEEEPPGGSVDQLRMRRPRGQYRLKSLQEEHRSMLGDLRRLRVGVRQPGGDVARRGWRIASVAGSFRAHERQEDLPGRDFHREDDGESG